MFTLGFCILEVCEAGEITQQLKALAPLPEDTGSILSTHEAAHNSREISTPSHSYPCRQNINTQKYRQMYRLKVGSSAFILLEFTVKILWNSNYLNKLYNYGKFLASE